MKRASVCRKATLAGRDRYGRAAAVSVGPAPAGAGIRFNGVTAGPRTTSAAGHATGSGAVRMVEHLMAACFASGITDLEVTAPRRELPLGDGSALPYLSLLARAGHRPLGETAPPLVLAQPVMVRAGPGFAAAVPSSSFRLNCLVPLDGIGTRLLSLVPTAARVRRELAPARTFAVTRLPAGRLARGLRPGFKLARLGRFVVPARPRFPDEPHRHKVLDLIGDLYLLGRPLQLEVFAYRPGHALNVALARALHRKVESC